MNSDISKALTFEIKKELADRYFGFRKFIEQEKDDLNRQLKQHSLTVEQKIGHEIVRICAMLHYDELISRFFEISGLDDEIFYDHYIINSPTIKKRIFSTLKLKGLTRAGRYKNLLLNCYDNLTRYIADYRENIASLTTEHDTIIEEINIFYRQNDITQIMNFLRNLDSEYTPGNSLQNSSLGLVQPESLEKKMRVQPPAPIDVIFSTIPTIPPLTSVKKDIKKLAAIAYKMNKNSLPFE